VQALVKQAEKGEGDIDAAARSLTNRSSHKPSGRPQGLRERVVLWRAKQKVAGTAIKLLDRKSGVGETLGVRDALRALGRLGSPGRLRARAEERAFQRSLKVAKRAIGQGDHDLARENLRLAQDLSGPDDRAMAQFGKDAWQRALRAARRFAKAGSSDATWQSLQFAVEAATQAGASFPFAEASAILKTAYTNEVAKLTKMADQYLRSGAIDHAALVLAQAREIQAEHDVTPRSSIRASQKRLIGLMEVFVTIRLMQDRRVFADFLKTVRRQLPAGVAVDAGRVDVKVPRHI
jgi:hypothetical protein